VALASLVWYILFWSNYKELFVDPRSVLQSDSPDQRERDAEKREGQTQNERSESRNETSSLGRDQNNTDDISNINTGSEVAKSPLQQQKKPFPRVMVLGDEFGGIDSFSSDLLSLQRVEETEKDPILDDYQRYDLRTDQSNLEVLVQLRQLWLHRENPIIRPLGLATIIEVKNALLSSQRFRDRRPNCRFPHTVAVDLNDIENTRKVLTSLPKENLDDKSDTFTLNFYWQGYWLVRFCEEIVITSAPTFEILLRVGVRLSHICRPNRRGHQSIFGLGRTVLAKAGWNLTEFLASPTKTPHFGVAIPML
jgi:hypothetical protein